jgi:hypothetical protein
MGFQADNIVFIKLGFELLLTDRILFCCLTKYCLDKTNIAKIAFN